MWGHRGGRRYNGRGSSSSRSSHSRGAYSYGRRGAGLSGMTAATGMQPRSARLRSLDLSELAQALPHPEETEDESRVRKKQALRLLMDASLDARSIPQRAADSTPASYRANVTREVLLEHRALLASARIFDEDWSPWPPQDQKGEAGQHANYLMVVTVRRPDCQPEGRLALAVYDRRELAYRIVGATCPATAAFSSCGNRFAAVNVRRGLELGLRDTTEACDLFVPLEYIGDALAALEACLLLQEQGVASDLFRAVARPTRRVPVSWSCPIELDQLNASQMNALSSLRTNLEAIQGPPGTGKSTIIFHLVKECMPAGVKTVVCAVQNRAVEAICERLSAAAEELAFFVVGNDKRLAETSKQWTLNAQASRDPRVLRQRRLSARAETMRRVVERGLLIHEHAIFAGVQAHSHREYRRSLAAHLMRQGAHRRQYGSYSPAEGDGVRLPDEAQRCADFREYLESHDGWLKLASAYTRARVGGGAAAALKVFFKVTKDGADCCAAALLTQAMREIATSSRVLLCTAASVGPLSHSDDENITDFLQAASALVADEAGTCPDRSIVPLLPLREGGGAFERLVLVGDEKQLPPFSRLDEHVRNPSLLDRVVRAVAGRMLTQQYRMPEELCKVVSNAFYDGALQTARIKVLEGNRMRGRPIQVREVRGRAQKKGNGHSLFNEEEAEVAVEEAFAAKRLHPGWSIAILAFYKAQVKLVGILLQERGQTEQGQIGVLSVDSAQGQEFDVVILSAVADGSRQSFLHDKRRQCVAVSRAKQRFVIVMHPLLCCKIGVFDALRLASRA